MNGRVTRLPFPYSLSSVEFRRALLGKWMIHKKEETSVSSFLCPQLAGKIPFASQATALI